MDAGVWGHALLILVLVDMAVIFGFLATLVDRRLLNSDRRWQFSLGTLFMATTLAAINLGAVAGFVFAE